MRYISWETIKTNGFIFSQQCPLIGYHFYICPLSGWVYENACRTPLSFLYCTTPPPGCYHIIFAFAFEKVVHHIRPSKNKIHPKLIHVLTNFWPGISDWPENIWMFQNIFPMDTWDRVPWWRGWWDSKATLCDTFRHISRLDTRCMELAKLWSSVRMQSILRCRYKNGSAGLLISREDTSRDFVIWLPMISRKRSVYLLQTILQAPMVRTIIRHIFI